MKHTELAGDANKNHTPSDRMHKQSYAFNWELARQRALKTRLRRAIHLARCNPDYQIQYPSECRDNAENKILPCCHPEAEKRIKHDHLKTLEKALTPTVERPKRMNKLG